MNGLKRKFNRALMIALIFITIGNGLPVLAESNSRVHFTAVPVTYTVSLNGQEYRLQAYTIKGSDFFKLRDIAVVMVGTTMQFQVAWNKADSSVGITTGKVYKKTGGELTVSETGKEASPASSTIYIDGNRTNLTGYSIEGNNYLKFTDIANMIGFTVEVDAASYKVTISGAPAENYEEKGSYVLTLRADNNEAFLNGEAVTLPVQPFIQNDIFYIPLEAVTKLLGGTYSFANNIAKVELSGVTTRYQIGSRSIIVNGETYVVPGLGYSLNTSKDSVATDDKFVPIISDGAVFIPDQFTGYQCPYNSILSGLREYPEARMVILGGFKNERGIHEIKLLNTYDLLPADFRSRLNYVGVVGEVINYNIEEYKNEGLEVYVMRINEPYDDIEKMDGRVCAIKVLGSQYSTPRGLKPVDSVYRAWLLYGYENLGYSFSYKVDGGIIESLIFHTRYYGSQL